MYVKRKETVWIMILLILILAGVFADVLLNLRHEPNTVAKPTLACQAIPTRYILEYPDCVDKLLRVMNVSNVKIVSGRPQTSMKNESSIHTGDRNSSAKELCVSLWRNGSISLEEAVDCIS